MIAPTGRAIALMALGAPLAVLLGLLRPDLWLVAAAWVGLCLALVTFDALLGPMPGVAGFDLATPAAVGVGDAFAITARVGDAGTPALPGATLALAVDHRLAPLGRIDAALQPSERGLVADLSVAAVRRGVAQVAAAWIGWTGPLGLVRKQRRIALDRSIAVVPSIRVVRDEGAALFARDAQIGQRLNARLGEGSEFESLVRFMPGLDRRAIDWKQSARHTDLLAKQYETERDNRIVIAVDAGRMMSEPVTNGDAVEPRLDRAVSAALTLAYVALRMEDRVSFASFAARPRALSREYARLSDFAALRRAAADIEYSLEETNFTLGLAQIGASLKRRALIVVFTEFADANSAELMLGAAQRLIAKHLLLFVVSEDSELEAMAARVPDDAATMTAATIAADLLRDRRLVLARLRRMGALVLEAPAAGLPAALLATYVAVKRQGRI